MERSRTLGAAVASLACLALVPGCSWFFVKAPPAQRAPAQPVACTSGKAAPVIDSVVAALQVVRVGYAIGQSDADYKNFPISRNVDIGLGVGLTALFAASAAYGFSATSTCAAVERVAQAEPPAPAPPAVPGAPAQPMATPADGCSFDAQCAGEDKCQHGECVPPAPSDAPAE